MTFDNTLVYARLTGTQKVAILLMAVGENATKQIFNKMEDDEIRQISLAMANLGIVEKSLVEQVLNEFILKMKEPTTIKGNFKITERFLKQVLPVYRQTKIVEDIQAPTGQTTWDKLCHVDEKALANYLKNEYPQTIAVILSQLPAAYVAKVMALLPENLVMDIVMRMLHLEQVQKDVLDQIEQTIISDFLSTPKNKPALYDGVESIADIFSNMDKRTENKLMTDLFERNRDIAQSVRSHMFTFEDLADLDGLTLQKIIRNIDRKQIAIALKGASESLKNIILENMSQNAGVMLLEDMDALGAVRVKEVDAAQTSIIDTIKKMVQDGTLEISDKLMN